MRKQLSQPDLAEITGLSKGYIYMLESGEMTNPSLDKLFKISEALDCTIADLAGEPKTMVREDAPWDIPPALQEFAKRKRREGDALKDEELKSLAHMQYRGKRPQTVEDWAYVYEFLKRTLGGRK
jgi:transcriptional regulator with XRE-family HTH domain